MPTVSERHPDDLDLAYELEEYESIVRNDFPSFVAKVFHTLNPTQRYVDGFYIDAICHELGLIGQGSNKRLIITLPPRSLKSICVSIALPAFLHGHNPSLNIVCASYAQSLSVKMQNDYRTILMSAWYRRLFPRTMISPLKNSEHEVLLTARGCRIATSVNGPLTGRGAELLIIDDPMAANEAHSEARRTAVNEWFGPVALSRLNDKESDAVIVVAQRLHEDDLIGYILRNDPTGWKHLCLPAIADVETIVRTGPDTVHVRAAGTVLRDSLAVLEQVRRDLGAARFEAQYQQRPTPPGGTIFKRKDLRYYDVAPPRENADRVFQSWDTASATGSHNDYSVCTTWHIKDGIYHLLDVWRGRPEFTDLKRIARDLAESYKVDGVLVEEANIGAGLISELKSIRISAIGVKPTLDKQTRAILRTPVFESGRVKFPRHAKWLNALEAELLAFPGGQHDDQVDSITQMLAYDVAPRITARWIKF